MVGLVALHLNAVELAGLALGHQVDARIGPRAQFAPQVHRLEGVSVERRTQQQLPHHRLKGRPIMPLHLLRLLTQSHHHIAKCLHTGSIAQLAVSC